MEKSQYKMLGSIISPPGIFNMIWEISFFDLAQSRPH